MENLYTILFCVFCLQLFISYASSVVAAHHWDLVDACLVLSSTRAVQNRGVKNCPEREFLTRFDFLEIRSLNPRAHLNL